MSSTAALLFLLVLYVVLPALVLYAIYRLFQTWKRGRQLSFESMPNLTQVTSKNLPEDITAKLTGINQKAKKLLGYYDNKQIKDEGIVGENQFLVKKILDTHLPEAIADYQRLDNARANQMAVGTTGKTARQLLNEYLNTINSQFDEMLDAMYEQNAQKLLVTNRYLQSRFADQHSELNLLENASQENMVVPPMTIKQDEKVTINR